MDQDFIIKVKECHDHSNSEKILKEILEQIKGCSKQEYDEEHTVIHHKLAKFEDSICYCWKNISDCKTNCKIDCHVNKCNDNLISIYQQLVNNLKECHSNSNNDIILKEILEYVKKFDQEKAKKEEKIKCIKNKLARLQAELYHYLKDIAAFKAHNVDKSNDDLIIIYQALADRKRKEIKALHHHQLWVHH